MADKKKAGLTFTKGGMSYEMEEVGAFSWEEREDGSISMHASPPGVAPPAAAARGLRPGSMSTRQAGPSADNVSGLLRKVGEGLTPGLQAKAEELRNKAKVSAENARAAAAAEEAAKVVERGRDPEAEANIEEPTE